MDFDASTQNGVSKGALQSTEMPTATSTSLAASIRSSWTLPFAVFNLNFCRRDPPCQLITEIVHQIVRGVGGKREGGGGGN